MYRLICALLLGLAAVASPEASADEFAFFSPVKPSRRVQVMAHRGMAAVTPENTAASLERAIADTVEWVEVDVRLTKDGRHVLLHDSTLDRTTNGTGRVEDRTLDEVKALDAGSKFASRFAGTSVLALDEILKLAKERANLYLDCKQVDPARLVHEVHQARMESQVVVFASPEVLRAIRATPGGDRLALMPKWHPDLGLDAFEELKPAAVEFDAADVTSERCQAFHRRGIKVQVKTLGNDDRVEIWGRVIEAGADWLQTDHAEEILAHEAHRRLGASRVKIAHHRGASRYAPENTLPAYEKAIRLGADYVEFDVRTTRDGKLFLLHDGSLNRTTTLKGPIRGRDASELVNVDAGAWFGRPFIGIPMPRFETFLDTIGNRVELYVDAKDIAPEALVDALRTRNLIDRSVVYQGPDYLARLRIVEPRLRRMPPLAREDQIDALAEKVQPYAFDTRWTSLSKSLIDHCHAKGIKVFSDALGLNESVESYRIAIHDGIDVIQTDYPVRVLRALELIESKAGH
ncbi:glycerophosphodiester phosphodiesterase [Singulisphaera rosea]